MNMISNSGGNCAEKIHHVHSNFLTWREQIKSCFLDNTLQAAHDSIKPNISIFTTGAHLQDLGDLDAILFNLKGFIQTEKVANNITFLWKTQNPGHYNCDLNKEPFNVTRSSPNEADKYHWNVHVDFDEYARNHSKAFGFEVVDMKPLYLRPDSHPGDEDCLHYCMPGPLDLFPVLLLQMLHNREI